MIYSASPFSLTSLYLFSFFPSSLRSSTITSIIPAPYIALTPSPFFSSFLFFCALRSLLISSFQMPSPRRQRRLCGTRSAPCWRRLTASWRSCSRTTARARRYEKWAPVGQSVRQGWTANTLGTPAVGGRGLETPACHSDGLSGWNADISIGRESW